MRARGARSMVLFLLVPALGAAAPLLLYPVVTSAFREDGFAAMAIGQSIGIAVGVVCELGWSVTGPQAVARMGEPERSDYHAASIASRFLSLGIGLPVAFFAAYALSPEFSFEAALIAAAATLAAISPSWVLTGVNRPDLLLLAEVLPRVGVTAVVALWIWLGGPLSAIAIINLVVVPLSLLIVRRVLRLRILPARRHFAQSRDHFGDHAVLTLGRSVTVVYTSLIPALVAMAAPGAVAGYAAADRLLRLGLGILAGVPSRLQNWIGTAQGGERRSRSRRSVAYNALLGAAAAVAYVILAPFVSEILFTGAATVDITSAAVAALIAFMICFSRGLGLALIAENRPRVIALGNVVAATVGVMAVFLLTPTWGIEGALVSVLLAEAAAVLIQLSALLLVWGGGRSDQVSEIEWRSSTAGWLRRESSSSPAVPR